MRFMVTALLPLLALLGAGAGAQAKHFQEWYRVYGDIFDGILHNTCSRQYDAYMTGTPREGCKECLAEAVIRCILGSVVEDFKANMASAAVLLGLLPSILSLAGSRTIETGLLAQRRPLLALATAIGTPAVWPIHSFDYHSGPSELFRETPGAIELPRFGRAGGRAVVVALQYVLALLAVANVLHVSVELSRRTVCTFTPSTEYLPLVWALTAIPIHLIGSYAFSLRARIEKTAGGHPFFRWVSPDEFRLSMCHAPATLRLRRETYWFIWWSWLVSTGTIVHIIFGTLMFSSILFISADYALRIVGRFLASTLACRIVLMFELAGMRKVVVMDDQVA